MLIALQITCSNRSVSPYSVKSQNKFKLLNVPIQKSGQVTLIVKLMIYINEKNTPSSTSKTTDTYSSVSQLINKEKLPI